LPFGYTFWPDIGPSIRDTKWHFNPSLIWKLLHSSPDYLLVGGLWDSLTTPLVSCFARRRVGIAWFEGNTHAVGRVGGLVGAAKKILCAQYQYVAVPGSEGKKFAELFIRSEGGPEPTLLPNIVDETRFLPKSTLTREAREDMRRELGVGLADRVALWPARLVPVKGVLEYLSILDRKLLDGWKVVLLGQGPLETQVEQLIHSKGLDAQILVKPYLPYERMPTAYAASDLFLLPSLYDPNPLSVVEAMHSGLPILVSTLLGNYPEACYLGRNGWGFDPYDKPAARQAASQAFSASIETLYEMGKESQAIAREFWGSTGAIKRFVDSVVH
jgi:glycosyltransferase involved in cell wall biosynthesis